MYNILCYVHNFMLHTQRHHYNLISIYTFIRTHAKDRGILQSDTRRLFRFQYVEYNNNIMY